MKKKISITLDEKLLYSIDQLSSESNSRSELIEDAVASYVSRQEKLKAAERERALLNKLADKLNREAEDSLSYQEQA